jgi:hypothetical protein
MISNDIILVNGKNNEGDLAAIQSLVKYVRLSKGLNSTNIL